MAKKNVIGINVTVKDAKKIVELAGLLAKIFTPTEETPVAVITEAAPAKKATVKKPAKAKVAVKITKAAPAKTKKAAKKSKVITKNVGPHCRVALPRKYLNDAGARWGQMDVLKKFDDKNAVYFIRSGASFNRKHYKKVKTINYNVNGQVNVGNLLKVKTGTPVKVNLVGDKIVVRK